MKEGKRVKTRFKQGGEERDKEHSFEGREGGGFGRL